MSYQDRFKLILNNFQDNTTGAFQELVDDQDFTEVTLVCEDGSQLAGHKVILAASSPFFKALLKKNKHPHPLILMRGLTNNIWTELINFIYLGEVQIVQEDLATFFTFLAEPVQLPGAGDHHLFINGELDFSSSLRALLQYVE